mgnify:CR=1 FL=1
MSQVGSVVVKKAARIAGLSVMLSVGAVLAGCQSDPDIDISKLAAETEPPEVLYNQGLANIKAGNMAEAGRKFDAVDAFDRARIFAVIPGLAHGDAALAEPIEGLLHQPAFGGDADFQHQITPFRRATRPGRVVRATSAC